MAKLKVFSVYDKKLKNFSSPMFLEFTGQAERVMGEIVNDGKSIPSKHPNDFDMYQIGAWDTETGQFDNVIPAQLVCEGISLKTQKPLELFEKAK